MKKILVGITVFFMGASAVLAAGKAAPAATGGVGYDAYGLQRYADFDAHQTTRDCSSSPKWSIGGAWELGFNSTLYPEGNPYLHDMTVTGNTAVGGTPAGGAYTQSWTATVSVTGNDVTIYSTYITGPLAPNYHFTAVGTIGTNGTLSGTWTDTLGDHGSWNSVKGLASVSGCLGTFHYSDVNGTWYNVDVRNVNIIGADAWFAGPVVEGTAGIGSWLFAKVYDGGTPGSNGDQIWGSFTNSATAISGVNTHGSPGDGPFAITSGNLVVH